MNSRLPRAIALSLGLLAFLASPAETQENTSLRIIYVSKMPELSYSGGGLEELAGLVDEARETREHALFLHGGDSLAPSGMSSFDRGTHMVDILNLMDPDAFAVNEREFAYKEDELVMRVREARFPFVSSNIYDPLTDGNLPGVEESVVVDVGDYQVGVLALIDPGVLQRYVPDRIDVLNERDRIREVTADLRRRGADLVVLMTSHTIDNWRSLLNAGSVDLILESSSQEDAAHSQGAGMLGRQGTSDGTALVIDLELSGNGDTFTYETQGRVVSLNDYESNGLVREKVSFYETILSSFMDVPVGITETPLDTTKSTVRTSENAFGNLVADSLRDYFDADIGLMNSGGIRGNRRYPAGTQLTRRDIQTELPFNNEARLVSITGAQLLDALEHSVSRVEDERGQFLQVSGMTVEYCPDAPRGNRIRSVEVNGRALRPRGEYTLATLDYLVDGGDGFEMIAESEPLRTARSSLLLWEVARAYIERSERVAPRIEGRLIVNCR